jgi:hypothetical protein
MSVEPPGVNGTIRERLRVGQAWAEALVPSSGAASADTQAARTVRRFCMAAFPLVTFRCRSSSLKSNRSFQEIDERGSRGFRPADGTVPTRKPMIRRRKFTQYQG